MRFSVASAALLLIVALPPTRAFAAIAADDALDAAALADLQSRAEHAQLREQAFLYTQLVHDYVEVAGRQVADGDMEKATTSLQRVQTFAERIHAGLGKDSRRVKNAEMLMHLATYKLSQIMHVISTEDAALIQSTLKRLDKLHDELLQQVFAH